MIAALARYKIVAEILAALAILASLMIGFHMFCESQREVGRKEIRIEWREADTKRVEAEQKLTASRQETRDLAVNQGEKREAVIKTLVAGTAASAASLRDAIKAQRDSNSATTIETLIKRANTTGDLLGDCADRYRWMAEKADRHASDARTLNDAWPK